LDEHLEDLLAHLRLDADPGVLDARTNASASTARAADRHVPAGSVYLAALASRLLMT
jgi:hypothetical protein